MELLIGLFLLIVFAAVLFGHLTILGGLATVAVGFVVLVAGCVWVASQD